MTSTLDRESGRRSWRRFLLPVLLAWMGWAGGACRAEETNSMPKLWFPIGESMTYTIYWGFIPVGLGVVTNEWVEEDGRKLLAIRIRTRTNKVVEKIYPVDDMIESIIDPETFLPLRFTKKLSEGRYRCHQRTTFDHKNLTARWEALDEGDDREETFPIETNTCDIISLMYTIRKDKIRAGESKKYRVMADEKMYDLDTRTGKKERLDFDRYGKVDCVVFEPDAKFGGLFVRKGRMWIWVSDDDRYLCAKISAQIPVASVNIELNEVFGPGSDHWTKPLIKPERTPDNLDQMYD
ncbi:MAG: DUF3108 domain-containing protein [Lentisphaerota bacterium]